MTDRQLKLLLSISNRLNAVMDSCEEHWVCCELGQALQMIDELQEETEENNV